MFVLFRAGVTSRTRNKRISDCVTEAVLEFLLTFRAQTNTGLIFLFDEIWRAFSFLRCSFEYYTRLSYTHSPQVTVDPRSSGLSFAFFLFLIQSKPPPVFYSRKFKNLTLTQMSGLGGKASRWMEKNCYAVITVQESEIKVLSLE